MSPQPSWASEIRGLRRLDRDALADRYRQLYESPAAESIPRSFLEAAVGYSLQKRLIAHLQHRLTQVLTAGEAIVEAASTHHEQTLLIAIWHGQAHAVVLLDDGLIAYQGQHYPSLEAVAYQITRGKRSAEALFGGGSRCRRSPS